MKPERQEAVSVNSPVRDRVVPVVRLRNVVEMTRDEQRKLLVAVDVDHGPFAQRPVQPGTDRAIDVIAAAGS